MPLPVVVSLIVFVTFALIATNLIYLVSRLVGRFYDIVCFFCTYLNLLLLGSYFIRRTVGVQSRIEVALSASCADKGRVFPYQHHDNHSL